MRKEILAAPLALVLAAGATAASATVTTAFASIDFQMGVWDPYRTCDVPGNGQFIGDIDVIRSGGLVGNDILEASAWATDARGRHFESQIQQGGVLVTNNSNATCTIHSIEFNGLAYADLRFTDPFEDIPFMVASANSTLIGDPPLTFWATGARIDSSRYTPPYIGDDFIFDSFSATGDLVLQPGESAGWDVDVNAYAFADVPAPTAALLLIGALAGLGGLRQRRATI